MTESDPDNLLFEKAKKILGELELFVRMFTHASLKGAVCQFPTGRVKLYIELSCDKPANAKIVHVKHNWLLSSTKQLKPVRSFLHDGIAILVDLHPRVISGMLFCLHACMYSI
jgi:hypothetical protein